LVSDAHKNKDVMKGVVSRWRKKLFCYGLRVANLARLLAIGRYGPAGVWQQLVSLELLTAGCCLRGH
jgi:hypothetical protein